MEESWRDHCKPDLGMLAVECYLKVISSEGWSLTPIIQYFPPACYVLL